MKLTYTTVLLPLLLTGWLACLLAYTQVEESADTAHGWGSADKENSRVNERRIVLVVDTKGPGGVKQRTHRVLGSTGKN